MPITGDRFDDIDDDGPTPGTNAHAILSFLAANAEQAFTQSEIAEATDVTRGSIGPTLVRLRERGHVDHRGTYWRVADDSVRRSSAASTDVGNVAADPDDAGGGSFDESAGGASAEAVPDPIDFDDWQAYAVDPRTDASAGYEAGAVVWASASPGDELRLWLVLEAGSLPGLVQEYTCAVLTATASPEGFEVGDGWRSGHHPIQTVYCTPGDRTTLGHGDVVAPQGAITMDFTERMRRER